MPEIGATRLASDSAERVWKASDVLLGGTISRVSVQRSDFRAFLDKTGAARLIARLQQQIADLSGGTMVSPRRRPPCRRERAFDLNGAGKSAAKIRGSHSDGDHHRG